MKQKYYVELNRQEWRLIIEGLNRFSNKLIAAGQYTDSIDEILIKVAKAKPQKLMLWGWSFLSSAIKAKFSSTTILLYALAPSGKMTACAKYRLLFYSFQSNCRAAFKYPV